MRCQVVLSGFDSRESLTIQQDLHFPIVLPSRNSYGATIIDGLSNTLMFGGKWYAILDAHADDTYTKSFASGESDAEIVISDAGTEVRQFIFIDASIGITEALAQAAMAISCEAEPNDVEIDLGVDYCVKEFNGGSSEFIVEVGRPTTMLVCTVSGASDAEIVASSADIIECIGLYGVDGSVGIPEAEALATLLATISAQPCESELDIAANGINKSFATVANILEIVLCSPTATIRYMCRLYEHDDKTVGEMDDIALHDLSFVEIDD